VPIRRLFFFLSRLQPATPGPCFDFFRSLFSRADGVKERKGFNP
jgi:hypothetical protein